jgi:P-type conjugative transfer protein TrbL
MKRWFIVPACALLAFASRAQAEITNSGVLDQALKHYRSAAQGWQSAAQGAATSLFWSLAAISLVWTMGNLALRRAELGEFFGELIRYILFTGFWAWMLTNGAAHAGLILNSMVKLAGSAGGNVSGQQLTSPSGVVDVGFHVVDRALTQSTILSPFDSAIGIVLSLVILVVLALVAVNMLVTLIACWIVAYGGLIVLGFGGSRWTSDMAMNYYRLVLSLALQVLAMVLLVGIGETFLRSYYSVLGKDVKLQEQAVLLVVSIVLLATVNRVPPLLGSLAGGTGSHHAIGGAGAGAALATVSTAGALAANAKAPAALLAAGTGWVAKATVTGALRDVGSVASAFGSVGSSVIDAFRAGGNQQSSGGSVFPAPPALETAGASATVSSAGPNGPAPRANGSGIEQGAAWTSPRMPGESDGSTEDADPGEASSAQQQDTLVTGADMDSEPSPNEAAQDFDSAGSSDDAGEASTADESAPSSSYVTSDIALPNRAPSEAVEGSDEGGGSTSTLEGRQEPLSSVGVTERNASSSDPVSSLGQANTPPPALMSMSIGSAPAGAFASALPNEARREAGPEAFAPAPPPAGFGSQPPRVAALSSAVGRSSDRAADDLAFFSSRGSEAPKSGNPTNFAKVAEAAERGDLPTAFKMQTAIDLEAEVAAFRDKES